MKCPRCGAESRVLETRIHRDVLSRRGRECSNKHRFATVEMPLDDLEDKEFDRVAHLITRRVKAWWDAISKKKLEKV